MCDSEADDVESLAVLFVRMGAVESQARVMAAQLLKRAGQLAEARGISKLEASEKLLRQVVQARQGVSPSLNTGREHVEGPEC